MTTTLNNHPLPTSLTYYVAPPVVLSPQDSTTPEQYHMTCVLIPYWIKAAMVRNKLDTIDVLDYDKLSQCVSLTDLAELTCLNDGDAASRFNILNRIQHHIRGLWMDWDGENYMPQAKRVKVLKAEEITTTILPLSLAETTKADVQARLSIDNFDFETFRLALQPTDTATAATRAMSSDWAEKASTMQTKASQVYRERYHRIEIIDNRKITIVLERGILNALEDRDYAKLFISDYLKACYILSPTAFVASGSAFETYLELL